MLTVLCLDALEMSTSVYEISSLFSVAKDMGRDAAGPRQHEKKHWWTLEVKVGIAKWASTGTEPYLHRAVVGSSPCPGIETT